MLQFRYLLLFTLLPFLAISQSLSITGLTCEHRTNPVGIENAQPRFSWKLVSNSRNVLQTAYALQIATDPNFSKTSLVWASGKSDNTGSILQPYQGLALQNTKRYYWQVKVWDNQGQESAWSAPAFFETGLPRQEWKAEWLEMAADTQRFGPTPVLRKDFTLKKKIKEARAYVTSHGYYELHLNGQRISDEVLAPGWTSYGKRLQYQVYDVTAQLKTGPNAIGAMLADGWYRGTLGWSSNWAIYGKKLGLRCQLLVRYTDGSQEWILSDGSWKGTLDGPVRMSGIYDGETYDARKEMTGWDQPFYNTASWKSVAVATYNNENLIPSVSVPVRRIQEIRPIKITHTPKGEWIVDMGQNMVGWVRLKMNGAVGNTVTVQHAEVLDKYGNFYTENLRSAKCEINYTLKGGGEETYEPHFTFMGFRYVLIKGFSGTLTPENLVGVVIHSDMAPTGSFECSNKLVNQLQHNIQWGQKGNFVDVPTDCPQRDERLGWTGDAQAFCRTAAFNMDVSAFFSKWLQDVAADQKSTGGVPFVIPDILNPQGSTNDDKAGVSAGWGDVALIAPWTMYQVYGDKGFLTTQYPSMKAYVEYIRKKAGSTYIWKDGSVFGDWLFYRSPMNNFTEPDGYTNYDFIATAFFAYSTKILQQTATVLGKTEDAQTYQALFEKIKDTFIREYVTPSGRIASDSQTSYVLALMFDLLPTEVRPMATDHLVADIKSRGNHLSTGFLGTPYLCKVLSDNGQTDLAYDLLLQETYPSWLYPVKMGATTIWERWDGQKTDSTFQDVAMNSFNHYAYGAIGDWMYRVSAGIELDKPGYQGILIQPHPTEKLSFAKATLESPYGQIQSGWERKNGKMIYTFVVPPNTTAKIILLKTSAATLTEKGQIVSEGKDFRKVLSTNSQVSLEIGSGMYFFEL